MPPCPHFDLKIVQRSKRQSAVAAAAYQSGERLFSEYDQKQKYYSHKSEIVHTEIMLPPHAPPEYADRNTLWNAAEAIEKQWNSQLARRLVLAIPRDIPPAQQADLIRDYCRDFFVSKGMIADFAIHDNSIQNCLTVFQHDPELSGAVAKNLLTERIDLLKPIGRKRRTGSKAMTDTDMKYIRLYLEKTYGLTSEKKIADAADLAADANSYHPIRDYLNGLVWDGKERIRCCLRHFLGADTDNYTFQSLRLFLLGAIHRAFCPGCKFEVMLCLVGGQGAGKSTFFRLLAVKDEWFSDDLRKLDDDNVYRKLQGHWIIEMSEMIATANAKSIEEIKSFLSRQKEVYKIPYETHPEDRLRQCVFGGTSNALDFLPLDRSGNRRFLPVMVYPERAEVHILDDEAASRAYIEQVWAEAMTTYKSGDFKLSFTPEMIQYLKEHQRDFMPEDTKAGMIQAYLDRYTGSAVCSKQLFKEALNHPFDEPKQWEIREVNDIMNHGITGWKYFSNPRIFEGYGRQKGWEREAPATGADNGREKTPDGFVEVTEQMELPF